MKTILSASIAFLTGCTVVTSPDGTVTKTVDYNAWFEITRLILTDEVPPVAIPVTPSK